jgi:hypothetical protein
MSSARPAHDGCKIGREPVDRPTSRKKREPISPKGKSMLRKVAIALVAASMLAAPVMAQAPAATDAKPAATAPSADKSAPATTVKANKSKVNKHSRAMRNTRTVSHKSGMTAKHAHHFNAAKGHKVAGTANKVVSARSAARSSVN